MADAIRWLMIREAADRACCRPARIQHAVRSGRLRSTRDPDRGELRFLKSWIDEWLMDQLMPEDGEIEVAIDVAPSSARDLSLR